MPVSVPDLRLLAEEELRRRAHRRKAVERIEEDWEPWLRQMFPSHVRARFAPHHRQAWEWIWSIRADERPHPFVGVWPRGGGKSSTAELAVVALGARRRRAYVVYVSATQDQADQRVGNIGALLESEAIARHYPQLGRRAVKRTGSSKGWRRNRLWTAHGLVVDALGLDTAAVRGLKAEDQRPDLIVLDDVDARHDSAKVTRKKIETITDTVLPIGADTAGVMALQNLIIPKGIFGRLADGSAGFLVNRELSGPVPAIVGLKMESFLQDGVTRYRITEGEATWVGQDLDTCQRLIEDLGPRSFLREQQHEVYDVEGALWKSSDIQRIEELPLGGFSRVVVGIDPSGGAAEIGIVAAGMLRDGRAAVLADETQPGHLGPANWARAAVKLAQSLGADAIAAERNFGGDMVRLTIETAAPGAVAIYLVNASRGKAVRAEPIVQQYANGKVVHLGVLPELEAEMTQWVPQLATGTKQPSPNRLDAMVWALTELFWPVTKYNEATW